MRRIILLVWVFALAASAAAAQVKSDAADDSNLTARPKSYVGDYAKVIDERVEQQLERKLAALRASAGIEFVVVTIETTGAEDIFDYSLAAARRWRLAKGANDKGGILLMLAITDRKWRVQLTDSLRTDLPETVLKVHGERMNAALRQTNNPGTAVSVFTDGIIAHLARLRAPKRGAR
ncbi:MAG TPA: TPM domain-containing protein [Pyrinomonadaceae bacterium]|jgi:uncharacterized membrane protein YgcG